MSNTPAPWMAGSFEAEPPFNNVVQSDVYYTVEAIRTIPEMQSDSVDIYKEVFKPIGVVEADATTIIERGIENKALIVKLTSKGNPPVYVVSTYLKGLPIIDGVVLEHLCIITDCGSVSPDMKDKMMNALAHFDNYMKDSFGMTAKSTIGYIPSRSYITKEQAELNETARQNAITDEPSDIVKYETLVIKSQAQEAYIKELEDALKAALS